MTRHETGSEESAGTAIIIEGARCAFGPSECAFASIEVAGGRIQSVRRESHSPRGSATGAVLCDLSGFLLLPGLINAHDHLEYSLFPRLADPPYQNYIEWGDDIHRKFCNKIAKYHAVPRDVRLWWGGIRNLVCGATTVSHHGLFWPELERADFPVRVVNRYGWDHSVALGSDLRASRSSTPDGCPFIVHACEGVDDLARNEILELDRMQVLDESTVLVHGLALNPDGIALVKSRNASLILCPSSNWFLFGKLPDVDALRGIDRIALGNDSPLTATGDLLDEIRFAIDFCRLRPEEAFRMVTTAPSAILRLRDAEGSISESGVADLVAIRDTGMDPAERLPQLSMEDVEFVIIGGRVQLASEPVMQRLSRSARQGLEPLQAGTTIRWLRAPVAELLRRTQAALGNAEIQMGSRPHRLPAFAKAEHVC